ncbi:MAG: YjhX family toxin [Parvibaculum sp.]|nr:YjhX family toxin [Parvibaculum sp.]
MNVSRFEQRVLHALAQGASIRIEKDDKGKIHAVLCVTREGWILSDCTLSTFKSLKRRRMIGSRLSGPYRITREGLMAVRGQPDNR